VSEGPCQNHAIRLSLAGADGKVVPEMQREMTAVARSRERDHATPLNVPAGAYALSASDVVSGVTTKVQVNVK